MKKSRFLAATAGAALLAGLVVAPSASAADSGVTFTVNSGSVSLAVVTADGNLSDPMSLPTGTTASGTIATVKVTDSTADTVGWSVTASMAGPFTDGATQSIPCTKATVTSGVATTINGVVTYTPVATPGALVLDETTADDTDDCAAKTIGNATVTTGSNDVTFATSVSVAIDSTVLAGTYSGTIVQTAA